jgi:hypothetical protein
MTVRIDTVRLLLAALAYTVFAYLLHLLGAMLTLDYYLNPAYFSVWSRILMPISGPPPLTFSVYSLVLGYITALLFAFIYLQIRPLFKEMSRVRTGATYGFGVFLVGGLPGFLMLWLLINLPFLLIVEWAIEGLIANLVGGVLIASILRD